MSVTTGREKIRADPCNHRNHQQRESSDEKAKSFLKQMALPGMANNYPRADGKKYDRKTADEREV